MSPLSRAVALRNKKYLNRVMRHLVPHVPGFALLTHRGRRSGRTYEVPLNVFRRGDRYVFALTYGSGAEWVRNVLAASGASMVTRGRRVELGDPVLARDPAMRWAPPVVRVILRRLHVEETLTMSVRPGGTEAGATPPAAGPWEPSGGPAPSGPGDA